MYNSFLLKPLRQNLIEIIMNIIEVDFLDFCTEFILKHC